MEKGKEYGGMPAFSCKIFEKPTFGNLSVRSEAESSHMRICGKERVATTELLMVA